MLLSYIKGRGSLNDVLEKTEDKLVEFVFRRSEYLAKFCRNRKTISVIILRICVT